MRKNFARKVPDVFRVAARIQSREKQADARSEKSPPCRPGYAFTYTYTSRTVSVRFPVALAVL